MANILEAHYQLETDFAREHELNVATVRRYRNQPDGLPFARFGGKVYIHIPGAREWLAKRIRHNSTRFQLRSKVGA